MRFNFPLSKLQQEMFAKAELEEEQELKVRLPQNLDLNSLHWIIKDLLQNYSLNSEDKAKLSLEITETLIQFIKEKLLVQSSLSEKKTGSFRRIGT